MAKAQEVERKWYVIDAEGKTLGRLARKSPKFCVVSISQYIPHVDTGDHVIVINAEKIHLTGKKLDQKLYRRHSQYPGGLKEIPYRQLMQKRPTLAIHEAVEGCYLKCFR